MKLVLDTNILVSALITKGTPPDQLYQAWIQDLFDLVSSDRQLAELNRVLAYEKLRPYIREQEANLLIENIDSLATIVTNLVPIDASPDPDDNWIIATAIAGQVDKIVSGDKSDLLNLGSVQDIDIINPKTAIGLLR